MKLIVVKDTGGRKGNQTILHGVLVGGRLLSITVYTDRNGRVAPETVARVKKQYRVDLPELLPAQGMEVPEPAPASIITPEELLEAGRRAEARRELTWRQVAPHEGGKLHRFHLVWGFLYFKVQP